MKNSIKRPPPAIIYRRLLYYAVLDKSIRYSGCKLMFVGRPRGKLRELKKVPCVAICERLFEDEKAFWLFYCDRDWNDVGVADYDTLDAAMHRAERMYPGISTLWMKAQVTKKQVNNYLDGLFKGRRCPSCNKKKPWLCGCLTKGI